MILVVFLLLFYLLGTICIKSIAKNSINGINEIYEQECIKQDVPYKSSLYGIYQLDKDKYLEELLNKNPDMSFEQAMETYNNLYYDIDSKIQSYNNYDDNYQFFTATYYITLLVSLFVSSFLFLLLIPLTNRNNKTLTMMLLKASLVDDKTNILCKNTKVATRFFTIYAIELAMAYAIVQVIGCIFLMIINIILISITKKKKTIHDFITQCHIEKDEFTYTA